MDDTQKIKNATYTIIEKTFPQCPSLYVDGKGRVTIPENIRRSLGIVAGDYIDLVDVRKCEK